MKNKSIISAYIELTKPRILMLVIITTVLGFYLGGQGISSWSLLAFLVVGSSFVCGGSAALNHYLEREFDSKMQRTKNRPIPSGTIAPSHALSFGILLVLFGIFILYTEVNILTAFLGLLTTFLYLMVYTPMKRVSWLNTTIGAVPGSIPPLGGWAAATGTLNFDAGILFLILFIWQHPHFYAIAWMFREDYKRGGFKMLPVIEPDGQKTAKQVMFYSILLIPVSLAPVLTGMSGAIYFTGALIAGSSLLLISRLFAQSKSIISAKYLLRATVLYLPILFLLIIMDKTF